MRLSNSPFLLLASLTVGVGIGWALFGSFSGSDDEKTKRADLVTTAIQERSRQLPTRSMSFASMSYSAAEVSKMSASEVIERLLQLDARARDSRNGAIDTIATMHQMHKVVRDMNLQEAESVLILIMEQPELNPQTWAFTFGLVETLLQRVMEQDMARAITIAERMDGMETDKLYLWRDTKTVIADILSRQDPEACIEFLHKHNIDLAHKGGIAADNIGRFAAAQGPAALLALEELLGTSGIDDALNTLPLELCETYAERWHELDQNDPDKSYHVRSVLERWSRLAPEQAVEWYRSKPELGSDVQLSYSMMNIILQADEKQGLNFAESEFNESDSKSRRLFTIAVNSHMEPEMWVKLAKRMPEDSKPTAREFSAHTGLHMVPGPKAIAAAAQCIGDDQERYAYLRNVLGTGGRRHTSANMWRPATALEGRKQLENASLTDGQQAEILKLYDEMTARAAGEN